MTNDEMDRLTARAENLAQSIDRLLLDGDGRFVRVPTGPGPGEIHDIVPASDVLRMLTFAEREAHALYVTLRDLPRRKVAQKGQA